MKGTILESHAQHRQTLKSFPIQCSRLNQHKLWSKSAQAPTLNYKLPIWWSSRAYRLGRRLVMDDGHSHFMKDFHPSWDAAEPLWKYLFQLSVAATQKPARMKPSYISMRIFNKNNPHHTHLRSVWRCLTHHSPASSFSLATAAGLYCTEHNFAERVSFTKPFYSSELNVTAIF